MKMFEEACFDFNLIDIYNLLDKPHENTLSNISPESLEVFAAFSPVEPKIIILAIRGLQQILFRNYIRHNITKRVEISAFPLCLSVHDKKIAIGLNDRRFVILEEEKISEYKGHSEGVIGVSITPRGIISASKCEIGIWSIE